MIINKKAGMTTAAININMTLSEEEYYALTAIFDQARIAFCKRAVELKKEGLPAERMEHLEQLAYDFFLEI